MSTLEASLLGSPEPDPQPAGALRAATRLYAERYGAPPRWLAVAPGRVNLIGEHTDYNDGYVLPVAIDRHVVIAAAPSAARDGRIRVYSAALDSSVDILPGSALDRGEPAWANYLRGVVAGFARLNIALPAVDAAIVSEVPLGGGLSSSAALEVATATLLEAASGHTLDRREKARLCRRAEHDFAGVPCGLMDQLASVFGEESGALLIDCQSEVVRLVPFADPGVALLICNTNMRHALSDGAYLRRRTECVEATIALGVPSLRDATPEMVEAASGIIPAVRHRARHVTTENARTLAAAGHLERREFEAVGALMFESHRSLRDDFEVSSPELDVLVDIAREIGDAGGVLGARMTGGGFGGCTVTLVRRDSVDLVAETLDREYRRRTGRVPSWFVSRPARGAHIVDPATVT